MMMTVRFPCSMRFMPVLGPRKATVASLMLKDRVMPSRQVRHASSFGHTSTSATRHVFVASSSALVRQASVRTITTASSSAVAKNPSYDVAVDLSNGAKSAASNRLRESTGEGASECAVSPPSAGVEEEEEEEEEEMFVEPHESFAIRTKEWGGPRRGGRYPEPTRYNDWERKGRCSDF